jgi:hypothetical protein
MSRALRSLEGDKPITREAGSTLKPLALDRAILDSDNIMTCGTFAEDQPSRWPPGFHPRRCEAALPVLLPMNLEAEWPR